MRDVYADDWGSMTGLEQFASKLDLNVHVNQSLAEDGIPAPLAWSSCSRLIRSNAVRLVSFLTENAV